MKKRGVIEATDMKESIEAIRKERRIMTNEEMKKIIASEIPFNDLKKDGGIYIFYVDGDVNAGISYESGDGPCDAVEDRYIFNLFVRDEYINVECFGNGYNDKTIHALVEAWNNV